MGFFYDLLVITTSALVSFFVSGIVIDRLYLDRKDYRERYSFSHIKCAPCKSVDCDKDEVECTIILKKRKEKQ